MADHPAFLLIDRTTALFCGVAAGIAIGLAFAPQLHSLIAEAEPPPVVRPGPPSPPVAPGTDAARPGAVLPGDIASAAQVPAGLARAVADGRPFRIGVFGDSFGDGLWAALYNQLPRREAFQVLRYSQQATGFTRYRQTNLEDALADQLAEGPIDVAVISFGANDMQGLLVDGRVAPLLSPAWQVEIEQRVTRYIGLLRAQGAVVVWIGLPVMRDGTFDAQVQGMNRFYAGVMARLGVPFIDTRAAAAGPDGGYASHLPDPETGAPRLVRAGDGIHMSMRGYRLLIDTLAVRVRAWGQAARDGKAVPPELVPPPAVLTPPMPAKSAPAAAMASAPPAESSAPVATAEPPAAASPPVELLPPVAEAPVAPEPAPPRS